MRTNREMRRLAQDLVAPLRAPVPEDPEALFSALVESVSAWRGREVVVHRTVFPPHLATGLWVERADHDLVFVDQRAAPWHQLVIFGHEVWHMHRGAAGGARTDFTLADEQEADRFGMLLGGRLRSWLEAATETACVTGDAGLARRIGAALDHRGTRP
ncbi:toxin [Streptomyces sp. NPDC091279]|uniref:toxin n=1 Tax=unclassified Streptomyces TaxID=2593676 RepID=UPI0038108672